MEKYRSREAPVPGSSVSSTHHGYWTDRVNRDDRIREKWFRSYGHFYYETLHEDSHQNPLTLKLPPQKVRKYLRDSSVSEAEPIAYLRACQKQKALDARRRKCSCDGFKSSVICESCLKPRQGQCSCLHNMPAVIACPGECCHITTLQMLFCPAHCGARHDESGSKIQKSLLQNKRERPEFYTGGKHMKMKAAHLKHEEPFPSDTANFGVVPHRTPLDRKLRS